MTPLIGLLVLAGIAWAMLPRLGKLMTKLMIVCGVLAALPLLFAPGTVPTLAGDAAHMVFAAARALAHVVTG